MFLNSVNPCLFLYATFLRQPRFTVMASIWLLTMMNSYVCLQTSIFCEPRLTILADIRLLNSHVYLWMTNQYEFRFITFIGSLFTRMNSCSFSLQNSGNFAVQFWQTSNPHHHESVCLDYQPRLLSITYKILSLSVNRISDIDITSSNNNLHFYLITNFFYKLWRTRPFLANCWRVAVVRHSSSHGFENELWTFRLGTRGVFLGVPSQSTVVFRSRRTLSSRPTTMSAVTRTTSLVFVYRLYLC